jgi:hypothetical protein
VPSFSEEELGAPFLRIKRPPVWLGLVHLFISRLSRLCFHVRLHVHYSSRNVHTATQSSPRKHSVVCVCIVLRCYTCKTRILHHLCCCLCRRNYILHISVAAGGRRGGPGQGNPPPEPYTTRKLPKPHPQHPLWAGNRKPRAPPRVNFLPYNVRWRREFRAVKVVSVHGGPMYRDFLTTCQGCDFF